MSFRYIYPSGLSDDEVLTSELRVVGKQPHGKQPDHAGGEGNAVQKI